MPGIPFLMSGALNLERDRIQSERNELKLRNFRQGTPNKAGDKA
jgi:hypothetical protein